MAIRQLRRTLCSACVQGSILMVIGLEHQLPMCSHLWVQSFGLAWYLSSNKQRCAFECGAPHVHQFYQLLADKAGTTFAQLKPVVMARRRSWGIIEAYPCLLIQAWIQILLGFVLPTLVLDWNQSTSGASRCYSRAQSSCVYLGLFMVAAVICWQALEVSLGTAVPAFP